MIEVDRWFRLTNEPADDGLFCGDSGLFAGGVALLEKASDARGGSEWRPRPMPDLNSDLAARYGFPIDLWSRAEGLAAVGRALDRGDIAHAQIAALYLQLPKPHLAKARPTRSEIVVLGLELKAGGLLKGDWDATLHPRWPAGSPDSIGGQFAPRDGGGDEAANERPTLTPAQIALPFPEIAVPEESFPLPWEITPPPLPRGRAPVNPYPEREKCVEEWRRAEEYCKGLLADKKVGKDGHRGVALSYWKCLMGQVSEDCGGNPVDYGA